MKRIDGHCMCVGAYTINDTGFKLSGSFFCVCDSENIFRINFVMLYEVHHPVFKCECFSRPGTG